MQYNSKTKNMTKYRITIEVEKVSENEAEPITGKYIVSRTNFLECENPKVSRQAYIKGIPCRIMSEPYHAHSTVAHRDNKKFIKVKSCITGFEYEIPYFTEWLDIYDSFSEVLTTKSAESLRRRGYQIFSGLGYTFAQLKGKEYYPNNNSCAKRITLSDYEYDIVEHDTWVAGLTVKIINLPYIAEHSLGDFGDLGKKKGFFILVKKENGELCRCPFEEYRLLP